MNDETDERSEAFERGLKTMERVALELYQRGREPLLAELETVKRERDEARAKLDAEYLRHADALRLAMEQIEHWQRRTGSSFERGAEAMREACAMRAQRYLGLLIVEGAKTAEAIRALPIPEDK